LYLAVVADLQMTYENLTTNLGKIVRKSYEVSKIEAPEQFYKTKVIVIAQQTAAELQLI